MRLPPVLLLASVLLWRVHCAPRDIKRSGLKESYEDELRSGKAPYFPDSRDLIPIYLYAAHQMSLKCKPRGTPRPTVRWFKNGEEVDEDTKRRFEPYEIKKYKLNVPNVR